MVKLKKRKNNTWMYEVQEAIRKQEEASVRIIQKNIPGKVNNRKKRLYRE